MDETADPALNPRGRALASRCPPSPPNERTGGRLDRVERIRQPPSPSRHRLYGACARRPEDGCGSGMAGARSRSTLPVPLGDRRLSILGDPAARRLPETPHNAPSTISVTPLPKRRRISSPGDWVRDAVFATRELSRKRGLIGRVEGGSAAAASASRSSVHASTVVSQPFPKPDRERAACNGKGQEATRHA